MLSLTDDQKSQATAIFTAAHEANQSIRTNMQTARESLAEAVKKNATTGIDEAAATIGTLTGSQLPPRARPTRRSTRS